MKLENLKEYKLELNEKAKDQLQKKQQQADNFQKQNGEDKHIAGMIFLKCEVGLVIFARNRLSGQIFSINF